MSDSYVNVKTDPVLDETSRVRGDGSDETDVIQEKLNLAAFFPDRPLFFPWGRYRVTRKLVMHKHVKICGMRLGRQPYTDDGANAPTIFNLDHTDTGIELIGEYAEVKDISFRGKVAADSAVGSIYVKKRGCRISGINVSRFGGVAAVRLDAGAVVFHDNWIQSGFRFDYDATKLRSVKYHGLWCDWLSDSDIYGNQIASGGAAIFLKDCFGVNVHDNFIFNSEEGVVMHRVINSAVNGNRVDENCRTGIVIDYASNDNTISANRIHNNGARTSLSADQRVGLVLRSGQANAIVGNTFANWDHPVSQPPDIDFRSPQQYGVRVMTGPPSEAPRPAAQYNLIGHNTFRGQRSGNIIDSGDGTNKFIGNVGPDFPDGLYTDSSPQAVTASVPPMGIAAGAAAAGLLRFRNRRSRARTSDA